MTRSDLKIWFSACALAALLVTCLGAVGCVPPDEDTPGAPDAGEVTPEPRDTALGAWDVVIDATACDVPGELRVMFALDTYRGTPIAYNREGTAWRGAGVEFTDGGARVWITTDYATWYVELTDDGVHARATAWVDVNADGCELVGGRVGYRAR